MEIVANGSSYSQADEKRLKNIWRAMHARCKNPKNQDYHRYGGRGIKVCEEWHQFEQFRDWAFSHGYDVKLSIDRENNNLGYTPSNCRWTDALTQARNKEDRLEFGGFGERKTIVEWSEDARCKVSYRTLRARISDYGWSIEDAVAKDCCKPKLRQAFGEKKSLAEWAADPRCVVSETVLLKRHMVRGMPLEEALTHPYGVRRFKSRSQEASKHGTADRTS